MLCNVSVSNWPMMFVNEAWEKLTGLPKDEGTGKSFWDVFQVRP